MTGREVHPAVLRYELIKSHYRSNLNFTQKGLGDSANVVRKLNEFRAALEAETGGEIGEVDIHHPILKEFGAALADDLNISGAMGVVMPWISSKPSDAKEALAVLQKINSVLSVAPLNEGIESAATGESDSDDVADQLAEQWRRELDQARANKNYEEADALRKKLNDAGFEVRTTKEGTTIQKMLV